MEAFAGRGGRSKDPTPGMGAAIFKKATELGKVVDESK